MTRGVITYLKPKICKKLNKSKEIIKEKNTEIVNIENTVPELYPEMGVAT